MFNYNINDLLDKVLAGLQTHNPKYNDTIFFSCIQR